MLNGKAVRRGHAVLAVIVAVMLPLASRRWGTGEATFTMFSGSATYRLRFALTDGDGRSQRVSPTGVAARVGGTAGDLLAGTEQWRHAPSGPLLRRRLGEVAALACRGRPGARRAEAVLETRRNLDAPVETWRAEAPCP